MKTKPILIRDVPQDIHKILVEQAKARKWSLQVYLLDLLEKLTEKDRKL